MYLGSQSWHFIPSSRVLVCCSCDKVTRAAECKGGFIYGAFITLKTCVGDLHKSTSSLFSGSVLLPWIDLDLIKFQLLQVPAGITLRELKVDFKRDLTTLCLF